MPPVGRGWERIRRLRRILGAAVSRPPPSRCDRCVGRGPPHGYELRCPDRGRGQDGRTDLRDRAVHRDGATGEFRHRGHHERFAGGARLHGSRFGDQVCRQLPRARRFLACQGRLRAGHLGHLRLGRRAGRLCRDHASAAVQRCGSRPGSVLDLRRQACGRDPRAGCREHGLRAASARLLASLARSVHRERDGADLRRGDDRVPSCAGRSAVPVWGHPRYDHAGQGHRRRPADRRVRRTERDHAARRPARRRLPRGDAFRESACCCRRSRDAAHFA